jgi:hypothetical protein
VQTRRSSLGRSWRVREKNGARCPLGKGIGGWIGPCADVWFESRDGGEKDTLLIFCQLSCSMMAVTMLLSEIFDACLSTLDLTIDWKRIGDTVLRKCSFQCCCAVC